MDNKDVSDEDLEKEFDKTFKANETKRNVFSILRKENSSLELKEKRTKGLKFKSD
jgi:hypothetical protein